MFPLVSVICVINLSEPPMRGLSVFLVHIFSCLVHRLHHFVKRDLSGGEQEAGKVDGADGPHRGDGVSFDAGDLDEAFYGVAGQAEIMFHGDLGGVFYLLDVQTVQRSERRGGHGTGAADLGLAAAFGAGNAGVCADDISDQSGHCQRI